MYIAKFTVNQSKYIMSCQYNDSIGGCAQSFTVAMPKYTFGRGTLSEAGARAESNGMKTVALFTDRQLEQGPYVATVLDSLKSHKIGATVFSDVRIEPDDVTVLEASKFLRSGRFDGIVSVGGGSVMDVAKAGMVYALYPAEFTDYFGSPVGAGVPVPGPCCLIWLVRPHQEQVQSAPACA